MHLSGVKLYYIIALFTKMIYLQIKIRVFKARFFLLPSRHVAGRPDFRAVLFAQLPLSLLLTRKRVLILL